MGEKSFLKISGIRKSFGSGENRTEVLKGIDFEVARGSSVCCSDHPDRENPHFSI